MSSSVICRPIWRIWDTHIPLTFIGKNARGGRISDGRGRRSLMLEDSPSSARLQSRLPTRSCPTVGVGGGRHTRAWGALISTNGPSRTRSSNTEGRTPAENRHMQESAQTGQLNRQVLSLQVL